ncbi:MAG: hypothetical protein C5B50_01650 [Verrucomicrobia bacterium]|nr:MAG: hypothetical protein C5B50_01650 [Verrucomicrobiota bacterium]
MCALSGCVSKSEAEAKARTAYLQGQREAELRMQQQPRVPTVTVVGNVSNPAIPWTEDLTLVKAIVAAGYRGKTDPTQIVIVRNGQGIQVDPKTLLAGEDVPLQANDVVALKQ